MAAVRVTPWKIASLSRSRCRTLAREGTSVAAISAPRKAISVTERLLAGGILGTPAGAATPYSSGSLECRLERSNGRRAIPFLCACGQNGGKAPIGRLSGSLVAQFVNSGLPPVSLISAVQVFSMSATTLAGIGT